MRLGSEGYKGSRDNTYFQTKEQVRVDLEITHSRGWNLWKTELPIQNGHWLLYD